MEKKDKPYAEWLLEKKYATVLDVLDSSSTVSLMTNYQHLRSGIDEKVLKSPKWMALDKIYHKHLKWRFEYQEKAFTQQLRFSKIISILVIVLVIAGIAFSGYQLFWSFKLNKLNSLQTEIAVEKFGKLSFRSSIIGITVLFISIAFFYLYLKYAFRVLYPIPPHIAIPTKEIEAWRQLQEGRGKQKK